MQQFNNTSTMFLFLSMYAVFWTWHWYSLFGLNDKGFQSRSNFRANIVCLLVTLLSCKEIQRSGNSTGKWTSYWSAHFFQWFDLSKDAAGTDISPHGATDKSEFQREVMSSGPCPISNLLDHSIPLKKPSTWDWLWSRSYLNWDDRNYSLRFNTYVSCLHSIQYTVENALI